MDLISRCKKKLSDEDGYTLAELMVTFALTGIFMICGITVLVSCTGIYMKMTSAAQAGMAADILLETLERELAGMTCGEPQVEKGNCGERISFRDASGDRIQIDVSQDGRLIRTYETADGWKEELFCAEGTYQGMKVTGLWFELPAEGMLQIGITLMAPGTGKELSRSQMIAYVL